MADSSSLLTQKTCIPCQGGIPPLSGAELKQYLPQINAKWKVVDDARLRRKIKFSTFPEGIAFVNEVARLAEQEGHHPDLHIHYDTLTIELWTHKIGGLHENDFIMAAKIDQLLSKKD